MKRSFFIVLLLLTSISALFSQSFWDSSFQLVGIYSPIDSNLQKAYFLPSNTNTPQPLVVSLHSWSADFRQKDSLAMYCKKMGWNYIHPDFRGPNRKPEAAGSALVVNDIDQAIEFAILAGNVDPENIHIIGSSGGGYATLVMYLKSRHQIQSFSAWVPISDLEAWYYESVGRNNKYATDIMKLTRSEEILDAIEAKKRSPMYMHIPENLASRGKLSIYTGIHDGYSGSVPITHSINFYNRMVRVLGGNETVSVPQHDIISMLAKRSFPDNGKTSFIGDRKIHYQRQFKDLHLTIFEGGHEMLSPATALAHIHNPATR